MCAKSNHHYARARRPGGFSRGGAGTPGTFSGTRPGARSRLRPNVLTDHEWVRAYWAPRRNRLIQVNSAARASGTLPPGRAAFA